MINFLGLLVLAKYTGWLVAAFVLWVVYSCVRDYYPHWSYRRALKREARQRAKDRAVARAEAENAEWLGAGIYEGDYPAATMPVTNPLNVLHGYGFYGEDVREPRNWYDYDDGMPEWK